MTPRFDLIVFDLGGVLIELPGPDSLLGTPTDHSRSEAAWHAWLLSPTVRAYESGRLGAADFAAALVTELALPVSPERFLDSFLNWPIGFFDGAIDLLAELAVHTPLAALTNMGALHWARFSAEPGFLQHIRHAFVSYQTGLLKPDDACFQHIIRSLGLAPERILFLDDNSLNVAAARRNGMVAECVRSVTAARAALQSHGVLSAHAAPQA